MSMKNQDFTIIVLLSLLGAGLVLFATQRYGIGLQSDSVGYIQVARGILQGQGISPAFTLQPPLYPALLALGGLLAFSDPLHAAVWVNALLFAAVIFLSGIFFLRHLPNFPALALLGTIGVLVSRPVLNVTLVAFSELFFIALVLITLVSLEEFAATNQIRGLVFAILATACACLTRYLGVTLIAAGGCALVWMLRQQPRRAIFSASAFVVLSAFPLALWAIRNILVSGQPFGARASSRLTFIDNLNLTAGTFVNWFVPDEWAWFFAAALLALIAAFLILQFRKTTPLIQNYVPSLAPALLFSAFFTAFLIITSTTTAYNRIGTRLLSPIYVPSLLLVLVALDNILNSPLPMGEGLGERGATGGRALSRILTLIVIALLFLFPLQSNWTRIVRAAQDGAGGYSLTTWRTSDTIGYVRAHRQAFSRLLFTNGPDALYILADTDARSVPPKYQYASDEPAKNASNLRGTFPPQPSTLVWLDNLERDDFLFTLPELQNLTHLTLIAKLSDGSIYQMERK